MPAARACARPRFSPARPFGSGTSGTHFMPLSAGTASADRFPRYGASILPVRSKRSTFHSAIRRSGSANANARNDASVTVSAARGSHWAPRATSTSTNSAPSQSRIACAANRSRVKPYASS